VNIESGVSTSTLLFDHNDCYNRSSPVYFRWASSGGDLAVWRSRFGYDSHSMQANPEFVSTSPASAGQLAVLSGSPTKGQGEKLNAPSSVGLNAISVWPATVDLSSQGIAWDIGGFLIP
jgi:hypothetical protein